MDVRVCVCMCVYVCACLCGCACLCCCVCARMTESVRGLFFFSHVCICFFKRDKQIYLRGLRDRDSKLRLKDVPPVCVCVCVCVCADACLCVTKST